MGRHGCLDILHEPAVVKFPTWLVRLETGPPKSSNGFQVHECGKMVKIIPICKDGVNLIEGRIILDFQLFHLFWCAKYKLGKYFEMLVVDRFWYIENCHVLIDKITQLLFGTVFPNCSSVEIAKIFERGIPTLIVAFFLEEKGKSIFENMTEFSEQILFDEFVGSKSFSL